MDPRLLLISEIRSVLNRKQMEVNKHKMYKSEHIIIHLEFNQLV